MTDEPRWLTEDEQQAWRPFVSLMFRLPAAIDAQLQRDAGLTHFEYMVLVTLSEAPEAALRMTDLAVNASGSLSRLSHVVSRMERRGWVRRAPCPGDGRFINAILTDAGFAKLESAVPGHVEAVRTLIVDALDPGALRALGQSSQHILDQL
jgi:DNA-binding MarR family transcriptional regulator